MVKIYSKTPENCSEDELKEFKKLVSKGGEVSYSSLIRLIGRAYSLIFIEDKNTIIGVAGIKVQNTSFRDRVFDKAQVQVMTNEYLQELGWIYILPSYQGKGIGDILMNYITTNVINYSKCYATTRENNDGMRKLLKKYSFKLSGIKFLSANEKNFLELYIRN